MLAKLPAGIAYFVSLYPELLACLAYFASLCPESTHGAQQKQDSFGIYGNAAVASDAGPCSVAGKDILKRGGSAVDAAIATMLCIGLYNAHSAGIGGGCYMTVYDAELDEVVVINGRETAPLKLKAKNAEIDFPFEGASCIAVPGQIAAFMEAHSRYGKLQWKELFEHSVNMAKFGYKIGKSLAAAILFQNETIRNVENNLGLFMQDENLKVEGDMVFSPELADTLSRISERPEDFYEGELAEAILEDIQNAPGKPSLLTIEDFAAYEYISVDHCVITDQPPGLAITE